MKINEFELIRLNDGGEVKVWADGQIDILRDSHMTVGFREARRRALRPEGLEQEAARMDFLSRTDVHLFRMDGTNDKEQWVLFMYHPGNKEWHRAGKESRAHAGFCYPSARDAVDAAMLERAPQKER